MADLGFDNEHSNLRTCSTKFHGIIFCKRDSNRKWKIHGDFTALNGEKVNFQRMCSWSFSADASHVCMEEPHSFNISPKCRRPSPALPCTLSVVRTPVLPLLHLLLPLRKINTKHRTKSNFFLLGFSSRRSPFSSFPSLRSAGELV